MRARAGVGLALAVILGLLSLPLRRLAPVLADPLGDVCYAAAAGCAACRIARGRGPAWLLALATFAYCAAIECSQLWDAPWLAALRRTLPGRLVLGSGFAALDLLWYALGAAAVLGVHRRVPAA